MRDFSLLSTNRETLRNVCDEVILQFGYVDEQLLLTGAVNGGRNWIHGRVLDASSGLRWQ